MGLVADERCLGPLQDPLYKNDVSRSEMLDNIRITQDKILSA